MNTLVDRRLCGLEDERFAVVQALHNVSLEHHFVDCDVVELHLHLCDDGEELVTHALGSARARMSVLRRRVRAAPCLRRLGLRARSVRRQDVHAASASRSGHGRK